MPFLLGCLALSVPRFVIALVFLFSDFLGRAYESVLWPLVGFFVLPLTTLAYAAAINWNEGSVSGGYFLMVLVAALIDLGVIGGGGWSRHRRRASADLGTGSLR